MNVVSTGKIAQIEKAGFRIKEFATACGLSRATIYALPQTQQPKSIKIGRARVIVESPQQFLQRLAEAQQQAA